MEENNQNTEAPVDPSVEKLTKIKKELLSWIYIIVTVFAFKSSFFEPNHIPSGSLLPTNAIGDFILVNKMSYGFKLPYSDLFGDPIYLTTPSDPKRGDIIVFRYPRDRNILYVKRVIGLPGDEVEVYNNKVYLNGKLIETKPVAKEEYIDLFDDKFDKKGIEFEAVELDGKKFVTAVNNSMPYHLNIPKVKVEKGHFFVMGDNRDYSSDSRVWGFVPFGHIRGRAMLVWFNMVYPWSKEKFHFRPWRIGTLL
ncbi:S26 family signal peptidase [Halobacteriovorax marinus]|uniref:Signal peptidase I n=1 Tax=Halobacteriovorax marinus (strain ATCC BAA-682 / DSM 15412 / SJ) TaxID=862908 RepID=E1X3B9_HALMS|nr:signal peptidase I [Halobacteriovorax marinus]ATH06644.1 S26 family signal peptidase [Halobacteriovorax marinus]CBW25214.1 signal peptidase I (leader peptidase I) [Halobacteriovorax marinus SJ]